MSFNINNVVLTGARFTKDGELKYLQSGGTAKLSLSIAVNDDYKDKSTGEWIKNPNYFNIIVWGKFAELIAPKCMKGLAVDIQGKLTQRNYETGNGEKKSIVEIIANNVIIHGKPENTVQHEKEFVPEYDSIDNTPLAGIF